MESNQSEGQSYHGKEEAETEGNGFLVSERTEDVDASGVDDHSTGMSNDDYLGKTYKEKQDD